MRKKVIAFILVAVMLVAAVPTAFAAGEYDDIQGHWGQAAIERWIQAGVAEGREDGSFAPNEAMTREETARMFANLLHLTKEANVSQYTDLDPNSPYYSDIAKCVAAGIFTGTSDHTMSPSAALTREQLFTTFARALGIQPASTSSVTFVDGAKVSDWAKGYVNALANMGAVRGVSDGSLLPKDDINRASVMAVLDQAISVYADTNGATVGESDGIVLVVADQVSVMGDVQNLVVAGGSASVSGGTVANASLVGEAAELNVSGNAVVAEIAVNSEGSQLNVSGRAQVGSVTVAGEATGTVVNVNDTAAVNTVTSQADGVTIAGSGTVNSAVVSGNNTAVNTNGTNLTVSQGTTGVTENGSAVPDGATVETAPSSPSTPSNPPVYIPTYYTVTFSYIDGTEATSSYVVAGSAVQFPAVTAPEGQKVSWYDETGRWVSDISNVVVTSDRAFTAVMGSDKFSAGNGTEVYPYLVASAEQFYAINTLADSMLAGTPYYFLQISDITGITQNVTYFRGTYDGGNYSIKTVESSTPQVMALFTYFVGDCTIKNANTYSSTTVGIPYTYMVSAGRHIVFENCTSNVEGNNTLGLSGNIGNFGFFVYYSVLDNRNDTDIVWPAEEKLINVPSDMDGAQVIEFKNCTNNGSVQNLGTCVSAFIGQSIYPTTKLIMTNVTNNGNIVGTSQAGLITGNSSAFAYESQYSLDDYVLTSIVNNGIVTAENANLFSDSGRTNKLNTAFGTIVTGTGHIENSTNAIATANLSVYIDSDGNFKVKEESNSDYIYQYVIKVNTIELLGTNAGVSNGRNINIDLTKVMETADLTDITGYTAYAYDSSEAVTNNILTAEEVAALDYRYHCENYQVAIVLKDQHVYAIFKAEPNVRVNSTASILVFGFNPDGTYIGSKLLHK